MEVPLDGGMITLLPTVIVGIGAKIVAEMCLIAMLVTPIFLKIVVPASYAACLRVGVMLDMLVGMVIDAAPCIGVDVLDNGDADIWLATKTALEFIAMLASSDDALLSGW